MHWTEASVRARTDLKAGYFTLDLDEPRMAAEMLAGQFVMVHRENDDFPFLPRPFSACDVVYEGGEPVGIRLLVQVMGRGTAFLSRMEPGDTIAVWGPLGRPFGFEGDFERAVMVAGGVGLAPFPILARQMRERNPGVRSIELLYGARSEGDLVYLDELGALDVELAFATEDGSRGHRGTALSLLQERLAGTPPEAARIFGCGPEPMLEALAAWAVEEGRPCEVSMERMMGCGVGACLACVVPVKADFADGYLYEKTCVEGPVVDVHRLHLPAL